MSYFKFLFVFKLLISRVSSRTYRYVEFLLLEILSLFPNSYNINNNLIINNLNFEIYYQTLRHYPLLSLSLNKKPTQPTKCDSKP